MPTPPRAYLEAMRRARASGFAIDAEAAQRIAWALEEWADDLTRALHRLPPERRLAAQRSVDVIRDAAEHMEARISSAIVHGLDVTVDETLRVWQEASLQVARSNGIPDAMLGAVRQPEVTTAQVFQAMQPQATWRTLVRDHVHRAASEAGSIVHNALLRGEHPEVIARALRPYVLGSERLPGGAAATLRVDELPADMQGAARQMDHNARRIAFSETHNARKEAEVIHFERDPMISLAQWTLSPNRGKTRLPCVCDALAGLDWYGLGPGIFPLARVPGSPHPWDRCEVMPVVRPFSELGLPKPEATLKLHPMTAPIPTGTHGPSTVMRMRLRLTELLVDGPTALT